MGTDQKGFGETRFLCPFSFRVVRVIRDGKVVELKFRDDDTMETIDAYRDWSRSADVTDRTARRVTDRTDQIGHGWRGWARIKRDSRTRFLCLFSFRWGSA